MKVCAKWFFKFYIGYQVSNYVEKSDSLTEKQFYNIMFIHFSIRENVEELTQNLLDQFKDINISNEFVDDKAQRKEITDKRALLKA